MRFGNIMRFLEKKTLFLTFPICTLTLLVAQVRGGALGFVTFTTEGLKDVTTQ